MTAAIIGEDFDQLDEAAPVGKLTDDQMRRALTARPLIESWLAAIEAIVKERLITGEGFDGFKIVEGRSLRKWTDDKIAAAMLTDLLNENAYTRKLISPAQAEKLLGKKKKAEIEGLIIKPRGAPTIATENDPRPSISVDASDFDAVDESE